MEAKENNTEEAILKAAELEFMEKGFAGAKTVAIAERAGVTHAMLHYYYRSKRNLYEKVLNEKIEFVIDSFIASFKHPGKNLVERVRMATETHFDFLKANPMLPRFLVTEVFTAKDVALKKMIRPKMLNVYRSVGQEIEEAIEKGEIRKIKTLELLVDIVSLNMFTFVALPLISEIAGEFYESIDDMLEQRKRENVKVIMSRIMIDNGSL